MKANWTKKPDKPVAKFGIKHSLCAVRETIGQPKTEVRRKKVVNDRNQHIPLENIKNSALNSLMRRQLQRNCLFLSTG